MTPRIDIGIDGGGTGCRVALSLAGGPVHETRGGAANIVTDPAGAEAAIRLALTEALAAQGLGLGLDALSHARICAGLAGARLPGEADRFATRLPFLAYVVDDSVTALEGALQGADGTLASLGTGSFFISKSGGRVTHVGGWGFRLGDEGSAAWAGRMALSLSLRVADGRLPPDPLAEALLAACPPHPVLWAREAAPGDFAQLVKIVMAHPGSPIAARVLAAILDALREGLEAVGHTPGAPWVLTGGLGRNAGRPLARGPARGAAPGGGATAGWRAKAGAGVAVSWLTGLDLLDGMGVRRNMALLVAGDRLAGVAPFDGQEGTDLSEDGARALVTPGLFDIQVNGGAGLMLGDCRTPADVLAMAEAHWATGTAAILPTLISDRPEVTARVIDLVAAAQAQAQTQAPGALPGLHLEGPHLAVAGAHDPSLLRPMTEADLALYAEARARLGRLLITVAPEVVPPAQIAELTAAGITVSLGHTACDHDLAASAYEAGAVMATHLFNAMSGLHHRAPGLVGATLDRGAPFGLIADGVHVHTSALRVALRASPGAAVLVSDAMAVAGTDAERFTLADREVLRRNGRLELADGTLAGADLTLVQAVENAAGWLFAGVEEVAPMAFHAPARVLGMAPPEVVEGSSARLLVWRGGRAVARLDGGEVLPVMHGQGPG